MEPYILQVGSREIEVDTTPLSCGAANFREKTLRKPRERRLVIKPSLGFRLFALIFCVLGGVFLAVALAVGGVGLIHSLQAAHIFLGAGLVFLLIGLLILFTPRRYEFDLDEQLMTVRQFWSRQQRPLNDILAVQLLNGGWHELKQEGRPVGHYFSYQFNLVFDDEQKPRVNLTNNNHWDATYRMADDLAAFLGVPLLDHVSEQKS